MKRQRNNGGFKPTKKQRKAVFFGPELPPGFKRRPINVRTGGFQNIESKFVDYFVNDDAFTTGWAGGEMEDGTALSISAVAQGDGESQRDGRTYNITSVHVNGLVQKAATESQTAPIDEVVARVVMVLDTQTNGAQLNAEDVINAVAAGEDWLGFRNLQNTGRFRVLKDKVFTLRASNATNEGAANLFSSGALNLPFKFNVKFKTPIKVRCTGTTAAIASIADNSIHIIGTSQLTTTLLSYNSRIRFTG